MGYVLVGDDCSDCCYLSNAFALLNLSHQKLLVKDSPNVLNNACDLISKSIGTFICKNLDLDYKKQILDIVDSVKRNIISWGDAENHFSSLSNAIHLINMPFKKYELTDLLAKIDYPYATFDDTHLPVFSKLIGQSAKMRELKTIIGQVAYSDTTVLILGQSGTGKDIVSSCIHYASQRKTNPFVPINCGAIPNELMESELFGHEKGAFTGAMTKRAGRFEIANHGTLFLDEIGDMPLPMQVKLLRVLQERKIERVGGSTPIDVDVRIIAATHKDLESMIADDQFREDLFYRLNVFPIYVPSLKEHKEDIPLIIDYQLNLIYERLKHRVEFTDGATQMLCDYSWPGNIRELQNFLERMVILYPDHVVDESKIIFKNKRSKKNKNVFLTSVTQWPSANQVE